MVSLDSETGHPLSTYTTRGVGNHPKFLQLRTRRKGVMPYVYLCTYTVHSHKKKLYCDSAL